MKWIKVAIGAVIAIAVVPIVVLSVINLNETLQPDEIVYDDETTISVGLSYFYDDEDYYVYEYGGIMLEDLLDYLENGFTITNLYDDTNEINITITNSSYDDDEIIIFDNNSIRYEVVQGMFYINKTYDTIHSVTADNLETIDITFAKGKIIKGTTLVTTLLSFVPIVFIGGVLLYFYKPFKRED